jgi:hypothetical protein
MNWLADIASLVLMMFTIAVLATMVWLLCT